MIKGIEYNNVENPTQIHELMVSQCKNVDWILRAFTFAWNDYELGKWKYDGATFVKENNNEFWEIAAFIHDWLNSLGYVGNKVDLYFYKIMFRLNYPDDMILERKRLMRFTFLNVWNHKYFKRDWIDNDIPKFL